MLVTRIIFLSFQNDESLQLFTYCHSEKAENLASSVDFRLIQNLAMLINNKIVVTVEPLTDFLKNNFGA